MTVDQSASTSADLGAGEVEPDKAGIMIGTSDVTDEVRIRRGTRAQVLGCAIDRLSLEESVAYCEAVIDAHGFAQHMSINVSKLVAMRSDPELRHGVEICELITADGQPVVWASRLLRDPLPQRVAGIDLMNALLSRAVVKGYGTYILGATQEILELAVAQIRKRYPGIDLAGYRDGYYSDAEEAEVASAIRRAGPDILLVAMSSPRKEYFLARHGRLLGVPFVMGVGGAIDVLAGVTRRAPIVLQRAGLEWLWRLAQEPRRLGPRYASTNTRFLALLTGELVRVQLGQRASLAGVSIQDGRVEPPRPSSWSPLQSSTSATERPSKSDGEPRITAEV